MVSELYFFIGGFYSPNYSLQKTGSELHYRASDFPFLDFIEPLVYVPEAGSWQAFEADAGKFAGWQALYASDVCDGIQWDVRIIADSFRLESYGSNVFPTDFDRLIIALRELTGNPDIFGFGPDEDPD